MFGRISFGIGWLGVSFRGRPNFYWKMGKAEEGEKREGKEKEKKNLRHGTFTHSPLSHYLCTGRTAP
jgi:hypothetical protein